MGNVVSQKSASVGMRFHVQNSSDADADADLSVTRSKLVPA